MNCPGSDDQFEQFWRKFPRKIAKKYARGIFRRVMQSGEVELDRLLKAVDDYARSVRGKDLQYVCHPSTWLAQGRWDDELGPTASEWSAADRWAQTVSKMRSLQ
jgi:hypothetical protein